MQRHSPTFRRRLRGERGLGLGNGATLAAGAAGATRTFKAWAAIPHSQPPPPPHLPHPRPHSSLPTTLPHPLFLQPGTATAAPPCCAGAWRGPTRGSTRADPRPCTPAGPASREYKNTGWLTELKQEQQTEAARSSSSSPVLSSSPNNIVLIFVDYCGLLFPQTILF